MSKHWAPPLPSVAARASRIRRDPTGPARPSRIRRDPLPIAEERKIVRRSDQEETWFGIVGVVIFAVVLVGAIVGVSAATYFREDPATAAQDRQIGQCYNAGGPSCVLDGNTIYVRSQRIDIAGMQAPRIEDASCDAERNRGIAAAMALAGFLNSGKINVGPAVRDEYGRSVNSVQVDDQDVAEWMIAHNFARTYNPNQNWC